MIRIYTDASVNRKRGYIAASCLILRDSTYVDKKSFVMYIAQDSLYAEVWGALQAIDHAKSVCDDFVTQEKTLYTDSRGVIEASKYAHENSVEQNDMDKLLQRVLTENKIEVRLSVGHSKKQNPNKLVDYFAKEANRAQRR